jgi:hypothetical protein
VGRTKFQKYLVERTLAAPSNPTPKRMIPCHSKGTQTHQEPSTRKGSFANDYVIRLVKNPAFNSLKSNILADVARLYGRETVVLATRDIPQGWILIAGKSTLQKLQLIIDPHPPTEKEKKVWDEEQDGHEDPNVPENILRTLCGYHPADFWNTGVEYEWEGKNSLVNATC